jgi:hypothetical protein
MSKKDSKQKTDSSLLGALGLASAAAAAGDADSKRTAPAPANPSSAPVPLKLVVSSASGRSQRHRTPSARLLESIAAGSMPASAATAAGGAGAGQPPPAFSRPAAAAAAGGAGLAARPSSASSRRQAAALPDPPESSSGSSSDADAGAQDDPLDRDFLLDGGSDDDVVPAPIAGSRSGRRSGLSSSAARAGSRSRSRSRVRVPRARAPQEEEAGPSAASEPAAAPSAARRPAPTAAAAGDIMGSVRAFGASGRIAGGGAGSRLSSAPQSQHPTTPARAVGQSQGAGSGHNTMVVSVETLRQVVGEMIAHHLPPKTPARSPAKSLLADDESSDSGADVDDDADLDAGVAFTGILRERHMSRQHEQVLFNHNSWVDYTRSTGQSRKYYDRVRHELERLARIRDIFHRHSVEEGLAAIQLAIEGLLSVSESNDWNSIDAFYAAYGLGTYRSHLPAAALLRVQKFAKALKQQPVQAAQRTTRSYNNRRDHRSAPPSGPRQAFQRKGGPGPKRGGGGGGGSGPASASGGADATN